MQINGFSNVSMAQQSASQRSAQQATGDFGKVAEEVQPQVGMTPPSSLFSNEAMTVLQQDEIKYFNKSFSEAYTRSQNATPPAGGNLTLQV